LGWSLQSDFYFGKFFGENIYNDSWVAMLKTDGNEYAKVKQMIAISIDFH
jgi:hypothetical protein